jgi:hypothetical protein
MSKFCLAAVAFVIVTLPTAAQSLAPQIITSSGGYFTGSNGALSFTIGETAVGSITSGAGSLTQGFQPTVSASNPLPLDFLALTAKLVDKQIQLKWVTTHEVNTNYYLVERSNDGQSFQAIATVAAVDPANTSSEDTYQATDSLPLPGTDYYRITEVDQNGQAVYSPIVSVKMSDGLSCMVYPNPAVDHVDIRITTGNSAQITIALYDLGGRLISATPARLEPGQNQFSIDLTGKSKGVYIFRMLGLEGLPAFSVLKE